MANPIDAGSIYSDVRIRLDRLNGDIKSVQTSLNKITKASNDTSKKSQSGFKKFFSFIKTSGVGAFLALSAVIARTTKFLKDSEKAASDAIEVYSKFDTVFETIRDSANRTADELSDSFGIAGSTARELLSATGDILVGFGFTEESALSLAKQTTELAADLASFTNFEGGAKRASEALTKALVGESESVKALGIVIRQDTKEYKERIKSIMETNNVTQIQAKALAALQIATEQSGKAIGDVSRTWDSAANVEKRLTEQTKSLKEAIGASLIPAVTSIRKNIGKWVSALDEVYRSQNRLVELDKKEKEGNLTYAERIELLELQIEAEKERIKRAEESGQVNQFNLEKSKAIAAENIKNAEAQIEIYSKLSVIEEKRNQAIIDNDKKAQALAQREQAVAEAQLSSIEELTKRQFEALSPQEQRLQLLQEEIDNLATIRNEGRSIGVDTQNIQNLINDLYREKIDLIKEDQKSFEISGKSWLELEQEKVDHLIWIDNLETEISDRRKQESDERIAKEQEEIQKRIALTFQYANSVMSIFSSIDSLRSAQNEAELQRLEESGATEEELAERKKELDIESAKREKSIALFNVAINTASAIVSALPNYILAGLAAVTGGIQAAAIAAEPIPSFATGGIVMPSSGGSLINVAENGSPELMLNSGASGQALLGDFANQIVEKMGGGNMSFQLVLPNGDVIAEAVAPAFNNGRVELKV